MEKAVELKVVLLGMHNVGKTCLVERFTLERWRSEPPQHTIGASFVSKKVQTTTGSSISLGIWDTAGAERYESMSRVYYRNAAAAVVCFDLGYAKSFEKVKFWVRELMDNEKDCLIYVCGTKLDVLAEKNQPRAVESSVIKQYIDSINGKYFETSSKSGENVSLLFHTIAEDFVKTSKFSSPPKEEAREGLILSPSPGESCTC